MNFETAHLNNLTEHKFTMLSLFSGAGGLDMGFANKGIETIWANDIDGDSCETHRLWSDAVVVQEDIGKINFSDIPDADIISGGFPCQGFSLAGPRKIDDARNTLYKYFVKLVEIKQPYAFVAENVKGILTLGNGEIVEAILADFSSRGYDVFPCLVNASDYGVPQDRWRVILMGFKKDIGVKGYVFPKPFAERVTLREALRNVPAPEESDICQDGFSSRYMSRNRKRGWDDTSFTIPAMGKQVPLYPSSPDMKKLGEDLWEFGGGAETRRFSWQEAAAIQTFPPEMEFAGNLTSKYRQIGNAVPVKLAEVIAEDLLRILHEFINRPAKKNPEAKAVRKTAIQTKQGKAFEYACLKALEEKLSVSQNVERVKNAALGTASGFYDEVGAASAGKMDKAAEAAYRLLVRLEPQLENTEESTPLYLSIQEDAKGQDGDVRDVLCTREKNGWEIGLSCKHNHAAVKHSRLSNNIDFGEKWFGIPCSKEYFEEIKPLFEYLSDMKAKGKKWSELPDKETRVYQKQLEAFKSELERLAANHDGVPGLMLKYLLGQKDFYKIITNDAKKHTKIQAYNLYGTLNKKAGGVKPAITVHQLKLPTEFFKIYYKKGTKNTIIVACDNGWTISFRIHNAKTDLEPSLKFDVQLIGVPQDLHTQIEPW